MTRQEANRKIVEYISGMVEKYPDWRFHQILLNGRITKPSTDQWYEESEDTLKNIKIPWE